MSYRTMRSNFITGMRCDFCKSQSFRSEMHKYSAACLLVKSLLIVTPLSYLRFSVYTAFTPNTPKKAVPSRGFRGGFIVFYFLITAFVIRVKRQPGNILKRCPSRAFAWASTYLIAFLDGTNEVLIKSLPENFN